VRNRKSALDGSHENVHLFPVTPIIHYSKINTISLLLRLLQSLQLSQSLQLLRVAKERKEGRKKTKNKIKVRLRTAVWIIPVFVSRVSCLVSRRIPHPPRDTMTDSCFRVADFIMIVANGTAKNGGMIQFLWKAAFLALGLSVSVAVFFVAVAPPPSDRTAVLSTNGAGCLLMRHVDGMEGGRWLQQPGLHNGGPYYYNPVLRMYLYRTRPIADDPRLYYAANPVLGDASVLYGYCGEAGLDIMDCGGRWRVNYVPHAASRFESCEWINLLQSCMYQPIKFIFEKDDLDWFPHGILVWTNHPISREMTGKKVRARVWSVRDHPPSMFTSQMRNMSHVEEYHRILNFFCCCCFCRFFRSDCFPPCMINNRSIFRSVYDLSGLYADGEAWRIQ